MVYKQLSILALTLSIVTSAFAGKGGPTVAGMWTGNGQAIYMYGTIVDIEVNEASLYQKGKFVYGDTQITIKIDDEVVATQSGNMSGFIQGNTIKGTFGGCDSTIPPVCAGAAILEGKITGKTLSGTVIDLSDGSTGMITLKKVSD